MRSNPLEMVLKGIENEEADIFGISTIIISRRVSEAVITHLSR